MKRTFSRVILSFGLLNLSSCQDNLAGEKSPTCEVGVFYGGQIQKKKLVEVSVTAPPKLGFRVSLPETSGDDGAQLAGEVIEYEITRPGPEARRVKESGTLTVKPEQREISQIISVPAQGGEGLWNVRVVFRQRILADRALYVRRPPA